MSDYIITSSIGISQSNSTDTLKAVYFETIDCILHEMNLRFMNNNVLYEAIEAMSENSKGFLHASRLAPLKELGITIPCAEEIVVAKSFFQRHRTNPTSDIKTVSLNSTSALAAAYEQRVALPEIYALAASVATFECSTAMCEASFSTLSRIDSPSRRRMTHKRLQNLVLLAFEKERTKAIDMNALLKKFSAMKSRRLQLFYSIPSHLHISLQCLCYT